MNMSSKSVPKSKAKAKTKLKKKATVQLFDVDQFAKKYYKPVRTYETYHGLPVYGVRSVKTQQGGRTYKLAQVAA